MKRLLVACLVVTSLAAECQAGRWLFRGRRPCASCGVAAAPVQHTPVHAGYAATQPQPLPQVNEAEVLRLGNLVQHIDGLHHASADDAYVQALSPPASDADKWFISIVTTEGSAVGQQLQQAFKSDPWLLALANPDEPPRSWAHYNVYAREDASQSWRFENVRISAYPTVLVQPPRSGKYGPADTVVYQGVYQGDPRRLAGEITQAIRQYVGSLNQIRGGKETIIGQPPWAPTGRDGLLPNFPDLKIPPLDVEHEVRFPWTAALTLLTAGFSIPAIIALVIWVTGLVRAQRKAQGKRLLMDDETFERLVERLKGLAERPARRTTRRTK